MGDDGQVPDVQSPARHDRRHDEQAAAKWRTSRRTGQIYFRVPDINAAIERIKANGGQILNGPMEVPGGDWIVNAMDPQGAAFSLHARRRHSRAPLAWTALRASGPRSAAPRRSVLVDDRHDGHCQPRCSDGADRTYSVHPARCRGPGVPAVAVPAMAVHARRAALDARAHDAARSGSRSGSVDRRDCCAATRCVATAFCGTCVATRRSRQRV